MIMVIDRRLNDARVIASMLNYMGIVSCVTTPTVAESKISNAYRAVIVTNPEKTNVSYELIRSLKVYSLGTPVIALCDSPDEFSTLYPDRYSLYDRVFTSRTCSSTFIGELNEYLESLQRPTVGTYRLAGIDVSVNVRPAFFDLPLRLTKTELMILRYLIVSYPARSTPKELIEHSFKPGRHPELSSVRTHVSSINKKFREMTGRNWINAAPGCGYGILTPELMCKGTTE